MSAKDINILPHKYYLRKHGEKRWQALGFTENGQSTFSRTIEKTTIDTEQMKSVDISITGITGSFSISSMETTKDNLLLAFPDATKEVDQNGNDFLKFGQDGGATPQYYELLAVSAKKLKSSGNYNVLYLAKVSPGGTIDLSFSQDTNVVLPLEFEILADDTQSENQKIGLWFESLTDNADNVMMPVSQNIARVKAIFSEQNNADITVDGTTKPTVGFWFLYPLSGMGNPIFDVVDETLTIVETTKKDGYLLSGKAQDGSTATGFVHEGIAFKADSLIGASVKFINLTTNETKTAIITAYNTSTKKFTLDSTISWLANSASGAITYEIMGAYFEYELDITTAKDVVLAVAGAVDKLGRNQEPYTSTLLLSYTV